jgi:hypothetical protein
MMDHSRQVFWLSCFSGNLPICQQADSGMEYPENQFILKE